jgi:hypothetical protein
VLRIRDVLILMRIWNRGSVPPDPDPGDSKFTDPDHLLLFLSFLCPIPVVESPLLYLFTLQDHPYDPSKDSILRRAKGMYSAEDLK